MTTRPTPPCTHKTERTSTTTSETFIVDVRRFKEVMGLCDDDVLVLGNNDGDAIRVYVTDLRAVTVERTTTIEPSA